MHADPHAALRAATTRWYGSFQKVVPPSSCAKHCRARLGKERNIARVLLLRAYGAGTEAQKSLHTNFTPQLH
jgi:hypothetical protein